MSTDLIITDQIFQELRGIIYRESGIALNLDKKMLLTTKLRKRLSDLAIPNFSKYIHYLKSSEAGLELDNLIDAISTNVTYFYRERTHFDLLSNILLERKDQGEFRIWSAAASSGEEPYSIAITATEALEQDKNNVRILATDICRTVLTKAIHRDYSQEQVSHVPPAVLYKYFTPSMINHKQTYLVHRQIAQMILFKRLNLARFPYPLKGPFDIIFCRNVLIYFDLELRFKVIQAMSNLLKPGGYLFLGHAENLVGVNHKLRTVDSSVLQK